MKSLSYSILPPLVFIKMNEETSLVPSMVLSTFSLLVFTTFIPQLIPLYCGVISSNSNV